MTDDNYQDVMASIPLDDGVIGLIVAADEDYGIIETADPKRVVVTVPRSDLEEVRRGLSVDEKAELLDRVRLKVRKLFE